MSSPPYRAFLAWLSDVYLGESLCCAKVLLSFRLTFQQSAFGLSSPRYLYSCSIGLFGSLVGHVVKSKLCPSSFVALAGSEAALLANLSAYTLSSPRVLRYATSREGLATHRAIMVIGGMASWILPIPFARLAAVFIGTWTGWLALFGNWARLRGSKEMVAEGQGKSQISRYDTMTDDISIWTQSGHHDAP